MVSAQFQVVPQSSDGMGSGADCGGNAHRSFFEVRHSTSPATLPFKKLRESEPVEPRLLIARSTSSSERALNETLSTVLTRAPAREAREAWERATPALVPLLPFPLASATAFPFLAAFGHKDR